MAELTYTDLLTKLKTQAKATETSIVTQLAQDYNTGYQQLLSKLTRYYVRKQQFADLVAAQQYYQVPVDFNKATEVTVQVTSAYKPPLKRVTSEEEWRRLTSYPMQSSWPTYYFVLGRKQIGLWPVPAASVDLGLRLVYQPRAFNMSIPDLLSTVAGATATVTNGSQTVTLSSAVLTSSQIGLDLQITGVLDDTFYPVVASTSSTLTLEAPYVGTSTSGLAWRIGQLPQLPPEFADCPIHYALWLYFDANGNTARAKTHQLEFERMTNEALALYSSAGESSVITDDIEAYNPWLVPPMPGP